LGFFENKSQFLMKIRESEIPFATKKLPANYNQIPELQYFQIYINH